MYKIVRHYFGRLDDYTGRTARSLTLKKGLTLEEAQAHCGDRETSSSSCIGRVARCVTAKHGVWFDGYERD